jgi:hypothetical protein
MRLFLLATALCAFAQEPGEAIVRWKQEIEARGSGPIVIVHVIRDSAANTITIPSNTPERELVKQYLMQEDLVRQLMAAHALTVSHTEGERSTNFILLNMDRAAEWQNEDALLAHELGHVWLKSMGYPAPRYVPGPTACLSTHTGDVVQHILMRDELDRRAIVFREGWIRDLQSDLAALESNPPASLQPCSLVQQAALWIDVRLGLTSKDWAELPRYEKALRTQFPSLAPIVDEVATYLKSRNVREKAVHREALRFVFDRLQQAGVGQESGKTSLPR